MPEQLHRNAERVLKAVAELDGRANTSEIRRRTGLKAGNIGTHTRTLRDAGLLEKAGSEDVGAPRPANVYELTEAGERRVNRIDVPVDYVELAERLETVEQRIDGVDEDVEDLESELEELRANQRELRDVLDAVIDRLN